MSSEDLIYDVAPGRFEERVIAASRARTVVVDFWAEWCAPCRALGPVLEDVVRSHGGRAALARVNVDQHQDVAARYGIRGIPAVHVFRDGQVVGQFVGALPRAEVERILGAALPSVADELAEEGSRLAGENRVEQAEERFRRALQERPDHAGALLALGTLVLEAGRTDEARELLSRIEENAPEHDAARDALARIEFAETCQANGGLEACRERAEATPDDLDARHSLACCLAADGQYGEALEEFLLILGANREYREGAAREAMVRIFSLVGPQGELAKAYRRKLAGVLY